MNHEPSSRTGRRALVTGAAGGIGRAVVERFLADGWFVALLDRPGSPLEAVATGRPAPQVLRLTADVRRDSDIRAAIDIVDRSWGALDVLVNNAAAVPARAPLAQHTGEQVADILDINLTGAVRLVQAGLPLLKRGDGPAVVNLSSIGASRAFRRNPGYCASKGAIEAVTRSLALDLAPRGIRVNAVAPGMVRTAVWDGVDPAEEARRGRLVPLGRPADPAEIAAVVAFLASRASSYVTGHVLAADGGLGVQAYAVDSEPGLDLAEYGNTGDEDRPTTGSLTR